MGDHQGSVIGLASCAGARLSVNRYDDWGTPDAINVGRFQYTGQAWLGELGLYHYKARLYSPALGRFLQTDPVGYDDQINLYAYVGNDPVGGRDPTGMAAETPWDAFNIAMGVYSFGRNLAVGNIPGAVVDALGIIYDTSATGTPGLPGGAGSAITLTRLKNASDNVAGAARALEAAGQGNTRLTAAARRIDRNVTDHLQPLDIAGAVKDQMGMASGGNHAREVTNALEGLRNAARDLGKELRGGQLSPSQAEAAKGAIRLAKEHISRIEGLLERANDICTGTRLCNR